MLVYLGYLLPLATTLWRSFIIQSTCWCEKNLCMCLLQVVGSFHSVLLHISSLSFHLSLYLNILLTTCNSTFYLKYCLGLFFLALYSVCLTKYKYINKMNDFYWEYNDTLCMAANTIQWVLPSQTNTFYYISSLFFDCFFCGFIFNQ